MPRMSKRDKREWGLFLNPRTGRKNYNVLCRKCLKKCKQSYRVIVVSCDKFSPRWGRKNTPDFQENDGAEGGSIVTLPHIKKPLTGQENG